MIHHHFKNIDGTDGITKIAGQFIPSTFFCNSSICLLMQPNLKSKYCIRVNAAPGFYFSIWVFGWGSIQKIPQKVDFLTKKLGFIQEKPQNLDFSHNLGHYSRVGQH